MTKNRWRNKYRIAPESAGGHPRNLACTICGHRKHFTKPGEVFTNHCVSFGSEQEAREYSTRIYQLNWVETLGPYQGNFDTERPEKGREGWDD